jgi:hypothetical protein
VVRLRYRSGRAGTRRSFSLLIFLIIANRPRDVLPPPLLDPLSSKEHGSQAQEAAERTTQTQVGNRRS